MRLTIIDDTIDRKLKHNNVEFYIYMERVDDFILNISNDNVHILIREFDRLDVLVHDMLTLFVKEDIKNTIAYNLNRKDL